MSYGDYVEQLTYLLFLKMDAENVHELGKPSAIPADCNCKPAPPPGDELKPLPAYPHQTGAGLGADPGHLPQGANRIQDPAKLERLIQLIDGET